LIEKSEILKENKYEMQDILYDLVDAIYIDYKDCLLDSRSKYYCIEPDNKLYEEVFIKLFCLRIFFN